MINKLKICTLALAFIMASSLVASAQIKPSKKKDSEKTETPSEDSKSETKTTKTTTAKKSSKKGTDQYFDESGGFKHRLWYGANGTLSFYGLPSGTGNVFTVGLTPMVGYKIIGNWSAGPRMGVTYTRINALDTRNQATKVNLYNFTAAAFTRYKIDFFPQVFAHAEYEYQTFQDVFGDSSQRIVLDADGKAIRAKSNRANPFLGLGYSSGGGLVAYEILALWNFGITQEERNNNVSPLTLRAGLTYKF